MAHRAVMLFVVILVGVGMGGLGFLGGIAYRSAPSGSAGPIANSTLSILAAGTLDTLFPQLARALANETPGVSASPAAQTYEGSLDVTTAVGVLHASADVIAVADLRLIPQTLEPSFARYEVVFGTTSEVLAYDPSVAAFQGVNTSNWAERLVADVTTPGNAPFAVWNASTDPNGFNEIFSLELQGLLETGSAATYYHSFYGGPAGTPAVPNPATTRIEKEGQAASLIRSGFVSAAITYRAYALANHLAFVPFDPVVGLATDNASALSEYARLSTTIVLANGSLGSVTPAPILFAATVPENAPNPALGAAFLHLLLSPVGGGILGADGGFTPFFPGWTDRPGAVPPVLAPDVTAAPPWTTGYLP